jgi:predicted sulfurtransferase
MRLFLLFVGISILAVAALTACNSAEFKNAKNSPVILPQNSQPVQADGARRVTTAELKSMLDNNEAVVIDVRNDAAFNSGHIRGARLIPEAELPNHLSELPTNKLIVTYCS